MPCILRSAVSGQDIHEIALVIARDQPDAALRWIDRIDEVLQMLAHNPLAGRLRDELAPGVRSFAIGNYVIFYRARADGIELIRVLHGARDLRRVFGRT